MSEIASLPIFGNVEGPLKLKVGNIIVVDELAHGLIVASRHHAIWSLLRSKFFLIRRLVAGVWWIASNHFLVLADSDTLSLQKLNILQPTEHFMLHDEDGFHLISTAFFDCERLVFERIDGAGSRDIDGDIGSSLDFLR
jgi:hypothetical protein